MPITVPTGIASNQTAQSGRLVVLVIDDLHIWRGRTETARTIARDLLSKLGRDASMAVLFTSGDHSTQVTDDPSRLLSAIATLEGRQPVRRPNQAVDRQSPRGLDPEMPMEQQLAIVQETQGTSVRQFADNMRLFTTLEHAARLLGAGNADRKAFVLVSEGIAKNPTGIFDSTSPPPSSEPQYHDLALIAMMEAMQRSNVTTYAIDPRGEVTSQELGLELHPEPLSGDPIFRWSNPLRQAQDGLATIAEASGGLAIVNTDDFTSGVDDILEDLDHYYLLGFHPADTTGEHFRPVRIEAPGHPDWTVRFRKGYRPGDARKEHTDNGNDSPLVALSANVLPAATLPLRFAAVSLPGSDDVADVALALEVSGPRITLEEADGRVRDELTYEVIVVDDKKNKVTSAGGLAGRITLSPAAGGRPLPDVVTYQVADTIRLRPGRYQLRISAMSAKLATGGSVYLDLDVPDFRKEPLAIGGLALGYAGGPRVAATTGSPTRALPAVAPPVLPFAPTLDRTFTASDTLRVYFEVASRKGMTGLNGTLAIVGADGGTVRASMPFVPDAEGRVDLRVPLEGLAPGAHILRVALTNGADSSGREIGFFVR